MADRGRVSAPTLVMAVVFLAVASVGFSGDPWWLFQSATTWIVAGLAALVGAGLLISSIPRRRRSRPGR